MGRGKNKPYRKLTAVIYSQRVRAHICPGCGAHNDATTAVAIEGENRERQPGPGDVTICAYCTTISVFTETGVRLAEQQDLKKLPVLQRRLMQEYVTSKQGRPT